MLKRKLWRVMKKPPYAFWISNFFACWSVTILLTFVFFTTVDPLIVISMAGTLGLISGKFVDLGHKSLEESIERKHRIKQLEKELGYDDD